MNALLEKISSLSGYRDLRSRLVSGTDTIDSVHGLGLPRSARLPVVAKLYQDMQQPVILITNRADRALALFDELQFWLGEDAVHYFPEPNPLFYERSGWGEGTRRDRLTIMTMLARELIPGISPSDFPPIIVAPVRAIMTRTIPRRAFLKYTRILRLGQQVTILDLTRTWVDIGYEYANIVVQPGQFSRRGGILDIWVSGEMQPVRIEFFGDEIDTMREFDPALQRTTAHIKSLTITPAREILAISAEKAGLALKDLNEFYIPVAHPLASSLLDFLPEKALIVLDGREFISAASTDIEEECLSRRGDAVKAGELPDDFPVPYLTWSELEDHIGKHAVVELGYTSAAESNHLAEAFEPGPRFAGKLRDFVQYLQDLDQRGEGWAIVSRQSSRLRDLWLEGQPVDGMPTETHMNNHFIQDTLAGGWILRLPEQPQLHLLTDGEIFGWSRPQPRRRYRPTAEAPESGYADLQTGDWVVHIDHGIGKYIGLVHRSEGDVQQEYLCVEYAEQDQLYVPIHHADQADTLYRLGWAQAICVPPG